MFCTACGAKNANNSNYCKQCGHKMDQAAPNRGNEAATEPVLPIAVSDAPSGRPMSTGALIGGGALLLVIGSLFGSVVGTQLQKNTHDVSGAQPPAPSFSDVNHPSKRSEPTPSEQTSGKADGALAGNGSQPATSAGNSTALFPGGWPSYPSPIYIPVYTAAPLSTGSVVSAATPATTRPRLRVQRPGSTTATGPAAEDKSGGRIVLPGDGETDTGEKGNYVIRVGPKSDDTPGTAIIKDSKESAPPSENKNSVTLSPKISGSALAGATQDARASIALGDSCKLRQQYDQAISFYHRALPTAGDEVALTSQKIGWCYQSMDKKDSAKTYYEKAIAEFKQLEAAGKLSDSLRDAQRSAEKGLAWSKS